MASCSRCLMLGMVFAVLTGTAARCGDAPDGSKHDSRDSTDPGRGFQAATSLTHSALLADLPSPSRRGEPVQLPGIEGPCFPQPFGTLLRARRSRRDQVDRSITKLQLARLLWATQGLSDPMPGRGRLRTAPSAGALYPLELYVVVGRVDDVPAGVYLCDGSPARLIPLRTGDWRSELAAGCLGQAHVARAALCLVWTAVPRRTTVKYGARGWRYLYLEAGHQAQNLQLAATALELSCCPVGAFHDDALARLLGLDPLRTPILYVGAVGPGGS